MTDLKKPKDLSDLESELEGLLDDEKSASSSPKTKEGLAEALKKLLDGFPEPEKDKKRQDPKKTP